MPATKPTQTTTNCNGYDYAYAIAIIGDGYAAAMLCLHLARQNYDMGRVAVIGDGVLGQGAAYGCHHPDFRLNVRADLMVVDSDLPDEFSHWAAQHISDPEAEAINAGDSKNQPGEVFYRRQDFARFVNECLTRAKVQTRISHIKGRAESIECDKQGWRIGIAGEAGAKNTALKAKGVIIATGNPPPDAESLIGAGVSAKARQHIITRAWDGDWLDRVPTGDHVLLVGGGLTAMDGLLGLHNRRHKGRVTLVTPRGVLPPPQAAWQALDQPPPPWPRPLSGSSFLRHFRQCLPKDATADSLVESPNWQAAFENVRTVLAEAWMALPESHRQRVLKHLGWRWSLLRYRAAPQTVAAAAALMQSGRMQVVAGRVARLEAAADADAKSVAAVLTNGRRIACHWLVVASGPGRDAFCQSLISHGIAKSDTSGRWLQVTPEAAVLGADMNPLPNLWCLGPPSQFSLGDVVGASTIARHAKALAGTLVAAS